MVTGRMRDPASFLRLRVCALGSGFSPYFAPQLFAKRTFSRTYPQVIHILCIVFHLFIIARLRYICFFFGAEICLDDAPIGSISLVNRPARRL